MTKNIGVFGIVYLKTDTRLIVQEREYLMQQAIEMRYSREKQRAVEVEENLGLKLATIHNIYFMQNMISEIRKAIDEERFTEFKREWLMGFVKR